MPDLSVTTALWIAAIPVSAAGGLLLGLAAGLGRARTLIDWLDPRIQRALDEMYDEGYAHGHADGYAMGGGLSYDAGWDAGARAASTILSCAATAGVTDDDGGAAESLRP